MEMSLVCKFFNLSESSSGQHNTFIFNKLRSVGINISDGIPVVSKMTLTRIRLFELNKSKIDI